ncbi:multisubunit Na+/H+ antiporter, MnhB subunit [Sphaerochaeta pleomorpha str. Grapes]|uniref:Multisubunit Na+/H+ antiporter, MnhB subunit n=1 Tax=Sphaerochaeta pleomorpha (strain ATCC BAA-1885 / DSM 22778 / Grapes) TaxID=158190 RepID=G8QTU9_SPHPG|nr:hydrogen gas-evolving membrane-bound hydrogenase subunit E [Sphaerochaeta pleomorpha]AEV29125.1 multisubunit Na+/H+ antiporter, MnhB subunit [Sphaerochaeta pleomorpha str. Grapes]
MKATRFWRNLQLGFTLLTVSFLLYPVIAFAFPPQSLARDYLQSNAVEETGAKNLVSSIYLGYRAFDTLGETIVLLVSVIGTLTLLSQGMKRGEERESKDEQVSFALALEKRKTHALRTNLMEAVSGKLGPIVLLFGFYVMLYGHISPGGGFQGGVIIASAMIFLALGNQTEHQMKLNDPAVLVRIEAASFLILVSVSAGSLFIGPLPGETMKASIIFLNILIGLKVGTSIAMMCIAMMGINHHD